MNIIQCNGEECFRINSDWEAQSKGLKEQYPLLSDTDLFYETGKENELICRLETRLNLCREAIIALLQKDVIVIANE